MERFALAAAVVLGFALTAALCSLFVPLRRVLERREQNQQPAQSEQPSHGTVTNYGNDMPVVLSVFFGCYSHTQSCGNRI